MRQISIKQAQVIYWLATGCFLTITLVLLSQEVREEYDRQRNMAASSADLVLARAYERFQAHLAFQAQVATLLVEQADFTLLSDTGGLEREAHILTLNGLSLSFGGQLAALTDSDGPVFYQHPDYASQIEQHTQSLDALFHSRPGMQFAWVTAIQQQARLLVATAVNKGEDRLVVILDIPPPDVHQVLDQGAVSLMAIGPCEAGFAFTPDGIRTVQLRSGSTTKPVACEPAQIAKWIGSSPSQLLQVDKEPHWWGDVMTLTPDGLQAQPVFLKDIPLATGWRFKAAVPLKAGIEKVTDDLHELFLVIFAWLLVGVFGHWLLRDRYKLRSLTKKDTLTGLATRLGFIKSLDASLAQQPAQTVLLVIDLDNFKRLNESMGITIADEVLKAFAQRLKSTVLKSLRNPMPGNGALFARLAADEFAVALLSKQSPEQVAALADQVSALFENGFELNGGNFDIQASIGIAFSPADGTDANTLLRNADAAMRKAKMDGKGCVRFFTPQIGQQMAEKVRIEKALRLALQQEHFTLVFMPVYDVRTMKIAGAEVLLRCTSPLLENLSPDQFIPVAESCNLIRQIDLWVIDEAFRILSQLQQQQAFTGKFYINFSAAELHNSEFVPVVADLLKKHQIDSRRVELEVTETAFVDVDPRSIAVLHQLKALGFSLALDDFGTGYTGFNQLKSFPVETLKIDRSFIGALSNSGGEHRSISELFIELSQILGLNAVAEGVETPSQLHRIQQLGCDYAQGYLLSKPLPLADFIALLELQGTAEKVA